MNQDIHYMAHAYAVGALSDDEATEYLTHLDECESCRREVAALLDVTSALSQSVAVEPPAHLRAVVMAAIASTPQEHDEQSEQAVPHAQSDPTSVVDLPAARTSSESTDRPTPAPRHASRQTDSAGIRSKGDTDGSNVVALRRSWSTRASSLVAAAAVLAAVAFGGMWIQSRQSIADATAEADELTTLLSADDVRTVPGVSRSKNHTGAIVLSRSEGVAVFVTSELPDLADDQVYEAWTIKGASDPQPAGTFTPQTTHSMLTLPAASFDADTMAITVEPQGGSEAPTSDAVVTFVMPQA